MGLARVHHRSIENIGATMSEEDPSVNTVLNNLDRTMVWCWVGDGTPTRGGRLRALILEKGKLK